MIDISNNLTDLLSSLIQIESETGDEKLLCDELCNILGKFNGEVIRVRNSVVFNIDLGKKDRIALIGHIDTVPIAQSSTTPKILDGELWGRGACDMKSGLACMLKVLHDISVGSITPKNNISLVFYENEEGSLPNGINFLFDVGELKNIDFAFVLEPTEGKYSVGCLGSLAVKKEVIGISAHSANPKRGKNALNEATQIFDSIVRMNELISTEKDINGLPYYETVNVTSFKTTTETFNVIPAKVEMIVNYRFSPNSNSTDALEYLFEYYGRDNITVLDQADSCFIGSEGDSFLLPGVEREIMQAWTDIAQLNKAGIPSINYGAGSIKNAHKPDERISIQELNDFYKLLVEHL